jgi:hypothetical protein
MKPGIDRPFTAEEYYADDKRECHTKEDWLEFAANFAEYSVGWLKLKEHGIPTTALRG